MLPGVLATQRATRNGSATGGVVRIVGLFLAILSAWLLAGCNQDSRDVTGRAFGEPCLKTEDCKSGLCIQVDGVEGVCSRACASTADCPLASNWGCVQPVQIDARVCGCVPDSASEICGDGVDNDCNSAVDDCRLCNGEPVANDDPRHCGECNQACNADQSCVDGSCRCPDSIPTVCGGQCIDTSTDPNSCGSCGTACGETQVCNGGVCTCPDPERADYCEGLGCLDLRTDSNHCGTCDHACQDGQVCVDATCACPDAASPDYCPGIGCVDTSTDSLNCGACGEACGVGLHCVSGTCVCEASNATFCGDFCVDTTSNAQHCGGCNQACGPGQICVSGQCSCTAFGATACGLQCAFLSSDVTRCGACDVACGPGENCVGGRCTCESNLYCQTACVPVDDIQNCGACGNVCGPSQFCSAGQCLCHPFSDLLACGSTCIDILSDEANCGNCGNPCPSAQFCSMGRCECPAGQSYCTSFDACFDWNSDRFHCGSCDVACAADEECVNGSCRPIVCTPNQQYCSGLEVRRCDATGTMATTLDVCSGTRHCREAGGSAACANDVCAEGTPVCNGQIATLCSIDGSGFESDGTDCAARTSEVCDRGTCYPIVCTPSEEACVNGDAHHCNALGTSLTIDPCASDQFCNTYTGASECRADVCPNGQATCDSERATVCATDGSNYLPGGIDCSLTGLQCSVGRCCGWGATSLVASDPVTHSYTPRPTIDFAGRMTVAFTRTDPGTVRSAWATTFDTTLQAWTEPVLLETDERGDVTGFDIMSDKWGNVFVGWTQSDGTNFHGWMARYDAATETWAPAERVDTGEEGFLHGFAPAPNGEVLFVVEQSDPGSDVYYLAARWFDSTAGWSTLQPLEGVLSYSGMVVLGVATDAQSNALVVWQKNATLRWTWFDAAINQWAAADDIGIVAGDTRGALAMAPDGRAVVVYSQDSQILRSEFEPIAKAWTAPTPFATSGGFWSNPPTVTTDGSGNWLAAWLANGQVFASRLDSGAPSWSPPQLLGGSTDSLAGAKWVGVVVDQDRNSHVIWYQSSGLYIYDIWASWYDVSSSSWRSAVQLENSGGYAYPTEPVLEPNGDVRVFWYQQNSTNIYDIWTRAFSCP